MKKDIVALLSFGYCRQIRRNHDREACSRGALIDRRIHSHVAVKCRGREEGKGKKKANASVALSAKGLARAMNEFSFAE